MRCEPSPPSGICWIAGAGPGDPGLVTLRTRECLEQADVIIYDALCNPEILGWARPDAELIYAGKKAGVHTLHQAEINALLVEKTRAGLRVLRLKGGDPFVFGRGGEEAEALAAAGLRFEIVPGVSSAIAAPAYAGIPLTHRECASQLTIFTGHEDPTKPGTAIDYGQIATAPGTKVMLMGFERLHAIVATLLAQHADPATPVALVQWGTTGRQRTLTARLDQIADAAAHAGLSAPVVAVFGAAVARRQALNWFETRPLFGKRIVVTRTRRQAGALSAALRALGADVLELPTIRIEPPHDLAAFQQRVGAVSTYDWIVFTSPNGVEAFFKTFHALHNDLRAIGSVRIATIGPATARRVRENHLAVDLQPRQFLSEGILEAFSQLGSIRGARILVVRGNLSRGIVAPALRQMGAVVDETVAYRTVPETADPTGARQRFRDEGADMLTFTSSSTVENFLALNLPLPSGIHIASIGPVTSRTLSQHGLQVAVEAVQHDIPGLVDAVRAWFASGHVSRA